MGPGPRIEFDPVPEIPAWAPAVTSGILPGLPGGEPYIGTVELERFADERLKQEVAAIRSLTLGGFIAAWDRSKYGGQVA